MSTQETLTPAQIAEDFLKKYATVIGTLKAIEDKDREFLLKYATVVGTPAAVDIVAPEQPDESTDVDENTEDSNGQQDATDGGSDEGTNIEDPEGDPFDE